eukprot:7520533-Pyramimonas_sp.AAC.1
MAALALPTSPTRAILTTTESNISSPMYNVMQAVPVPPQDQHSIWNEMPQNNFYKAWMELPGQGYSGGIWPQH